MLWYKYNYSGWIQLATDYPTFSNVNASPIRFSVDMNIPTKCVHKKLFEHVHPSDENQMTIYIMKCDDDACDEQHLLADWDTLAPCRQSSRQCRNIWNSTTVLRIGWHFFIYYHLVKSILITLLFNCSLMLSASILIRVFMPRGFTKTFDNFGRQICNYFIPSLFGLCVEWNVLVGYLQLKHNRSNAISMQCSDQFVCPYIKLLREEKKSL